MIAWLPIIASVQETLATTSMERVHPWWLIAASLAVALFPMLACLASSYVKVAIVLNMLRSGFGAQGVPGSIVIMALSMSITFLVMGPVLNRTIEIADRIPASKLNEAPSLASLGEFAPLLVPWREFLEQHAGKREIATLQQLGGAASTKQQEVLALSVLLPAFLLSEIKQAFTMGFALLLPFLAVDLIVANVLTGLGMMMASPVMIALPIKVLLFILADGWLLLARGLITSYGVST